MRRADRKRPSMSIATFSNGSSAAYTPKQRAQLQQGLRILARMIVRAHLCREVSRYVSASPEAPLEGETGG